MSTQTKPAKKCRFCLQADGSGELFTLPICQECKHRYDYGDWDRKFRMAQAAYVQIMLQSLAHHMSVIAEVMVSGRQQEPSDGGPFAI